MEMLSLGWCKSKASRLELICNFHETLARIDVHVYILLLYIYIIYNSIRRRAVTQMKQRPSERLLQSKLQVHLKGSCSIPVSVLPRTAQIHGLQDRLFLRFCSHQIPEYTRTYEILQPLADKSMSCLMRILVPKVRQSASWRSWSSKKEKCGQLYHDTVKHSYWWISTFRTHWVQEEKRLMAQCQESFDESSTQSSVAAAKTFPSRHSAAQVLGNA